MISKRIKLIKKLCKNKNVLDIGVIDHNLSNIHKKNWLHKHIKEVADKVLGIDILKEEIDKLKEQGYNVIYDDAQKLENVQKIGIKFDVVVAGEIIEHLENPGLFLDNVKKVLKDDGILIITTPNCFSIRRIIGMLIFGKLKENKEHMSYYSDVIIKQLLERKGYKVIDIYYLESEDSNYLRKLLEKLLYCFVRKQLKHTLFVIAKVKK